jgi:sulfatase maturation enzyme AslB (radical SAM superfamily)
LFTGENVSGLLEINSLRLILTSQCNLRCTYCYQNAKRARRMRWATLRSALDLILDSARDDIGISFSGGEPLLEFPVMRRAVEYVEKACPASKLVSYSISTNATLLTEEIAAFLEEHRFQTQLSLDGAAGAQNLRARGTFAVLDRALARLRKKHSDFFEENLRIGITATPSNLPYLARSIDYFLGKGVREISITPNLVSDAVWRLDRIDELDAQFARILKSSLKHMRKTGYMPVVNLRNTVDHSARARKRPPMCGIARGTRFTVDVDGEVYGCDLFAASYQRLVSSSMRGGLAGMRMGTIGVRGFALRHASFPAAVRRARIFDRKDRKYSAYGRCNDCIYFTHCLLCPACIPRVPGNSDPDRVSDFCCAFSQVSMKYRERSPREPALPDHLRIPPDLAAGMEKWRFR